MALPKFLSDSIASNMPKLNLRLAKGLSHYALRDAPRFLLQLTELIARDFPPGITFDHISFCTPEEEYEKLSEVKNGAGGAKKGGKKGRKPIAGGYQFAKTDMYLLKAHFSVHGKRLPPVYMSVPFARVGGWTWMRDSQREIHPACCDTVISIDNKGVFIKLHRDKFKIERKLHPLVINNMRTTGPVLWSKIHKAKPAVDKSVPFTALSHSIPHYLFAKYGFMETFDRFLGFRPIIGMSEINTENYPEDKYVIYSSGILSMRMSGARHKKKKMGPGTHVRFAVDRSKITNENSTLLNSLITGYYYVADHFPESFPPDGVFRQRWAVRLGYLITGENLAASMLLDKCEEHLRSSLDTCLDTIIIKKLEKNGIIVNDIYELFVAIINRYVGWTANGLEMAMTLYGKEFSVLYYALENNIHALTNTFFELTKQTNRTNRQLTDMEVYNIISKRININSTTPFKSKGRNGRGSGSKILNSASYPGDNWAFKVTRSMIPQTKFEGGNRSILTDPAAQCHVSICEAGNAFAVTKSSPDGRGGVSHFVKTDEDDRIVRNMDIFALTDWVQQIIKRN